MSKLIPQPFIDDLLARIDIAEVVGTRVKLKRAGANLLGLCPFHAEKTPSFTVSPTKQFFHCFGCGAHGSAIGFIMQFEHLSFIEAVENIASQLGMTVPKASGEADKIRYTELYELMARVAKLFQTQLRRSQRSITYLKSRGLTGEICKYFGIGYAPNDWSNLASIYQKSPFDKKNLVQVGMLIEKNNQFFSRFRDRIMFPIIDYRGHIIGFGGRTLGNDPAKYLNSPETVIFHKGNELYGLFGAKKNNRNLNQIIVVEGYMDVIALAQFGITNAVATLGTAITPKQVQLLLRNTQNIVFCFDGDQAGQTAAWRALENSLPLMRDGIQIKFLFLPETDDPDSLIRKESKEAFLKRVVNAMPLSDFFFSHLTINCNLATLDGRSQLVKNAKNYLNKMPFSTFRQLLTNKLADLVHISPEELSQSDFFQPQKLSAPKNSDEKNAPPPIFLQNAISLLLHHPQLIDLIENIDDFKTLTLPGINVFIELSMLLKKQQKLSTGAILEYWRDRDGVELLADLATKEQLISINDLKNEFIDIIHSLVKLEREQNIQDYLRKASTVGLNNDEKIKLHELIAASKQ